MGKNALRIVFRQFFKRQGMLCELNEELASHIALETKRRVQDGESLETARQTTLREFGNLALVAEVTRDQWDLRGWSRRFRMFDMRLARLHGRPCFPGL
jgi:hypothetical protein